ncbi:MAG: hypothetical protein WA771_10710 [Chthoniobacterales bacterium]
MLDARTGAILSEPKGYFGGVWRSQAIKADAVDNMWIASFENDSLVVFKDGNPDRSVSYQQYLGSKPFGIEVSRDGSGTWVTNSGGLAGEFPSSVARFRLNATGELEQFILRYVGKNLRVVESDSLGNAWVASQGDNTVYVFSPSGALLGGYRGGGIDGPWGLTIDGDDHVWLGNFGPIEPGSIFSRGRLSRLCGANPATWPRNKKMGDPLSPNTGYTVRSAGSQVLLSNGDPLYGPGAPPSFAPMMRQTSVQIDAAGNLWTINNWKPDFDIDATTNPGGDGIIIFVGLAPPQPR